ncbi:MAG TPA: hypothetical protein PKD63_10860 [Solirubrobacteraceae bacterium]|nr:hypothetical protein [Solirubrobacteraceae bacterium]
MTTGADPVTRLTGVYHADGSLLGELRYVAGTLVGRAHCSLCDITHGRVREKARWRAERERLPVPFTAVHLDERSPAEAAASDGRTPCVLAHTDAGIELLLGPAELSACDKDPATLVAAIETALAARDSDRGPA